MCLIEQTIKIGNSQHRDRPRFHVEHSGTLLISVPECSTEPFFHKIKRCHHQKVSIFITTCINNHHNKHYKHMFLKGTYGFNQFFSGSEYYTDICNAYKGNFIIFTFQYKREFLIYIVTGKRRYNFF